MKNISPEETILLAKLRHIEELERLSISTAFIETIGLMIHQLQAERGVSCLYLASLGKRLANERQALITSNMVLGEQFNQVVQQHLNESIAADAKQLTLIAWILLGLTQLKSFRHEVTLMNISFADCMQSYTRLIGSLIALMFEITDSTVDSQVSTDLVALFNLVQGKEFAGQERAVGAYMFGSGLVQIMHQQTLLGLIDIQERHFEAFSQLASQELKYAWDAIDKGLVCKKLFAVREKLSKSKDYQTLNVVEADAWFDICSQRLTEIWSLQCQLIHHMHHTLETLISEAKLDLERTRANLKDLKSIAHAKAPLDSTFFNLSIPIEQAFSFHHDTTSHAYPMESVINVLQAQSQQIAKIENELSETKKALAERKQIERAKGLIMAKMGITELEAYKVLRTSAMEQNRKIIDIAENILSLAKNSA